MGWEHRTAPITAARVSRIPNNRWVPFTTLYIPVVPSVGQGYIQIVVAAMFLPQEKSDVQGCIKVKLAVYRVMQGYEAVEIQLLTVALGGRISGSH